MLCSQRLALRDNNISRYNAEFHEVCKIGTGSFGTVYKCINRLGMCKLYVYISIVLYHVLPSLRIVRNYNTSKTWQYASWFWRGMSELIIGEEGIGMGNLRWVKYPVDLLVQLSVRGTLASQSLL